MLLKTKYLAGAAVVGLALAAGMSAIAAAYFAPEDQPVGYVGQPVPSSLDATTGTAKMFAIDYSSADWSGNVHAYPILKSGLINSADSWKDSLEAEGAGGIIREQNFDTGRLIVTRNDNTAAGQPVGIPFRWANMSGGANGRRMAIDGPSLSADSSALFNYLRGDKANEGDATGKFRKRSSGLGDIVHSTPVYWEQNGSKTLFVGANDGMLHAIDVPTGKEVFAYVPGVLIPELKTLSDPLYKHRYYVDGRLDVRKFGDKQVLVGSLGAGGKALFALDVTTMPTTEADAASKVMWEITSAMTDYTDLGDTYSAPVLATLKGGQAALVVGNGYNNKGTSGHAVLYVIDALTGTRLRKIDTGAGTAGAPNGLSSPSLWDSDNDGFKDTAYAGDIDGNMWKFDLLSENAPVLLHKTDPAQAITMAPALGVHPSGGMMVNFVTGRMLNAADAKSTDKHYAYGIWDKAPAANTTLLGQTVTEHEYKAVSPGIRVRSVTSNVPDWKKHKGWRTELPIGGERVVGDGAYVNAQAFQFFSTNPTILPDVRPPGENWWMQLNYMTGGNTKRVLFDLNADAAFTETDMIPAADSKDLPLYVVGRHMGGGVRSQLVAISADGIDRFQASFDRNGAGKPPVVEEIPVESVVGERGVSGGHFDTDVFCYNYCGNLSGDSNLYTGGVNSAAGAYGIGRNLASGEGGALNYVHVHEYDDIYDAVGLNMLHPSQDAQRLPLVLGPVSTSSEVPTTQLDKKAGKVPASAVIVGVPQVTTQLNTTSNTTANTVSYGTDTPKVYVSGPTYGLNSDSKFTATTVFKYTSTAYTIVYTFSGNLGTKKDPKYTRTTTKTTWQWTTELRNVDTMDNPKFKVLMANQAYSPAVSFSIEGTLPDKAGKQGAYADKVLGYQTAPGLTVADLGTYSMSSVKQMIWSMPLNAFNIALWGGVEERTGLHPINPPCVGVASAIPKRGPNKEWRNGALTVQVVRDTVTDSDMEMNVAGKPTLGYRLKPASMPSKLIAEYLIYWHHPSNTCMTDKLWTQKPEQDLISDAKPGKPANGAADPQGVFVPGTGKEPPVIPPTPAPTIIKNADGSVTTIVWVITPTKDGYIKSGTKTTVYPNGGNGTSNDATGVLVGGGVGSSTGIKPGGSDEACKGDACVKDSELNPAAERGRINWRELQR